MNETIKNKLRGIFYGLAIGDALGAAVEFRHPGSFAPVFDYRGFGPHHLNPGEWTDDTSMALALAESIAVDWNPKTQLKNYLKWYREGKYSVNGFCFDIGNTTRTALENFEKDGRLVADAHDNNSGNGSIMRLGPIAIKLHNLPFKEVTKYAKISSETTHASPKAIGACKLLACMLVALSNGESKNQVLAEGFAQSTGEDFNGIVKEIDFNAEPPDIKGSGYVVKSLEAAIWAVRGASSFEESVLRAVNLGEDADTTGAVAGQLAGACWGYNGIPVRFIQGLAKKEMIEDALENLIDNED